ncbi:MAG: hypothetical protein ACSHX0_04920 [Akkermansiaceae bacterium]
MKNTIKSATLLSCSLILSGYAIADETPTGTIDVTQAVMIAGSKPDLTWKITYPVTELPFDPETNEVTEDVTVMITVVGVGITDGTSEYPSTTEMKFSTENTWTTIYNGVGTDVPEEAVVTVELTEGTTIQFRSKVNDIITTTSSGKKGKKSTTTTIEYPYYYNNSSNVTTLVNGDAVPGIAAGHSDQASVAEFLGSYVNDETTKIELGPMDMLYAAELTHSDPDHSGFDMQDTIILVEFIVDADEN